jgi:aryl-alcohol dehydrogenase-like predicted oxidoreductase
MSEQKITVPKVELRPGYAVPQVIKGNWQIADDHSSSVDDNEEMYQHMAAFADAGITAFDCGDIYHGVEARIGNFIERFRKERGTEAASQIAVHTKYVPHFLDEAGLRAHSRDQVVEIIDRSLRLLKVDVLDMVQLHWWNYDIPGNVETALILKDLQNAGKIKHIGGTNYNVVELKKMVDAGVDIVSNQVQYSLTDRRPLNGMTEYCQDTGIALFAYGTIAGGLFSAKWHGIQDPGKPAFENVSLDKYYRIIVDFGGWALFQELLDALGRIGDRHGVSIAAVASRYVLQQPAVAAVIQGSRHARHLEQNLQLFTFALDEADYALLDPIFSRSTGPAGDCYDLDRIEDRDAQENVSTEYFDVEDGRLVTRTREAVTVSELYGHHLKS